MPHFKVTQIPLVRDPITYSTVPAASVPFFTSSTISQPVGSIIFPMPQVVNPGTYLFPPQKIFNTVQTIAQPVGGVLYQIPSVNTPSKPRIVDALLPKSISQPFFTPYDVNKYVYPANQATYSKSPQTIFVTVSDISQPVGVLRVQIPNVFRTAMYFQEPPEPTGEDSYLNKSISQPYFPAININLYIYRVFPELIFNPPPISLAIASWLSKTISQPYFIPWDENKYGILPVDVSSYAKNPSPPIGAASWLTSSISQPYFIPYDINKYVWNPNAGNLRTIPAQVSTYSSWATLTISQPFFIRVDVNGLVWNANPALLPGLTTVPKGFDSYASKTIHQPYFPSYNEQIIGVQPVDPGTYSNALTTQVPFFTSSTIAQPVGNIVYPQPEVVSAATLRTLVFAYNPSASVVAMTATISQPFFTPYNVNNIVWNSNAGNLLGIVTTAPTGVISLLSKSIHQPYFPQYDINKTVWPSDINSYAHPPDAIVISSIVSQPVALIEVLIPGVINTYKKIIVLPPNGVDSYLTKSIAQPIFLPVPNHILTPTFLFQKTALYDWKKIQKGKDVWTKIPKPQF